MQFRIGINLGDVIYDDYRIYGDGINVAARLEGLAEPGGILISHAVYEQLRDRLDAGFDDLGPNAVADVSTRLKMGKTSNVTAVVKADGKLYTASKEVKVTIGGCGG